MDSGGEAEAQGWSSSDAGALRESGPDRICVMREKTEQLLPALRHDDGMGDQTFEWVTLFCFENVAGCPRPGRLTAV
ncbi:hypothetical protein [Streptomyces sp. NPDC004284]|uniref:hypothetical protein n=1 Tax=Streptomyces sp. NPDC004284 TaxID=3364695 RepID=UPI00368DD5D3